MHAVDFKEFSFFKITSIDEVLNVFFCTSKSVGVEIIIKSDFDISLSMHSDVVNLSFLFLK